MLLKQKIISYIEDNKQQFIEISHSIHQNPEIGNEEFFASDLLSTTLQEAGFTVRKNIAGHETGFIASRKATKKGPVIAYLAEYDALPDLGHACGHNIIAATSIAAAVALSTIIDEVGGEVRVYGTPAEEGGTNGSAKASFVKAGVFNDVDVSLIAHPGSYTATTSNTLAVDPIDYEFFGKPAHAAASPEDGINALDAMILFYNGIGALRQQLTNDVRIHGVILDGGKAANIIPDYTRARFYIRSAARSNLNKVVEKVNNIAQGAALATGTTVKITPIQNGVDEIVPNKVLDQVFTDSIQELGEVITEDITKGMGSTDVGNVSQVVPTIHPTICITDTFVPAHTKEFEQAAISSKGNSGLILGAKALAITGIKVLTNPELLNQIKQ